MQEVAVVLREPDDRRARSGFEIRERGQVLVLRLLDVGIDRPSMGAAFGPSQALLDPLDHLVRKRVAERVRVHVRLRGRVAHEVRQQPLDDPVLADDPLRALPPGRRQQRLLVLAALDQALALEPLEHLSRRRPRDAEHLRDARRQRGGTGAQRPVFADRKGQEVDRLEVFVD